MNLKESYRYANYLDGLLSTAYNYLRNKGFVTTTVEEHLRKQSNPDVENETIEVQKPFDVEFKPNDVIDFVVKVIEEKEKLSESIAKAKNTTDINIDNAIAMNKNITPQLRWNSEPNIKPTAIANIITTGIATNIMNILTIILNTLPNASKNLNVACFGSLMIIFSFGISL